MSYEPPFAGYPGQVFATCWLAANWFGTQLASGGATPAAVAQAAIASYSTFANGADAVAAWQAATALSQEVINLNAVQALPLSLDPVTQSYFTARVASISAAASGLIPIYPAVNPFAATGLLAGGQPAVPVSNYLPWCAGFTAETAPSGLTAPGSLLSYATGMATAWQNVARAVGILQGQNLTSAYDTAARQFRVATLVAKTVRNVSGATNTNYAQTNIPALWNGVVALPSILLDSSTLTDSPASLSNQQCAVIRFALRRLALQTANLIYSLRASSSSGSIGTATLRQNETLMDLAARTAGGFEEWSTIAAINGLQPPYPGPTNQALANSGTTLLLPGSVGAPSGIAVPTYANNVLGVDYDFGPINGTQPPWLGDISLIAGYANFARALGRRIQTTLGTLIYEPSYGSRIPPEVGAIQSSGEAQKLAAFGSAALSADPRTASIAYAAASVQPGFLATFSGVVNPIGPGATPVGVSEVISPLV